MFTGIIDHVAEITKITHHEKHSAITIKSHFQNLILGESIAIDGICLTVTSHYDEFFTVELSLETLKRTMAKTYQIGSAVNLERALRLSDRLGGHLVTGHVDTTLIPRRVYKQNEFLEVFFSDVQPNHRHYLIEKGSIAINGVSLTINDVLNDAHGFTIMLIPHTLTKTNLKTISENQLVNIEFDCMAKNIHRQFSLYMEKMAHDATVAII